MQKIFLSNGKNIDISELKKQDKILGPNGLIKNIISTKVINGSCFKITPMKGDSFIISENQKLSLVMSKNPRRDGEILEINPENLLSNKKIIDSYKLYRTIINDIWKDKDLKIDPYFLGVLLGDGSGFGSGKTPEISKPDSEIRELVFAEAAKWNLEVREYGEPSNPTYRLVRPGVGHGRTGTPRSSHSLKRELDALGYRDMSCENRFVNNKYKFSSTNTRAEVLAGLLDTDGYYQNGGFDFTSKSNILASDVQFLARSIGLAAYKRKVIKSCQNNFSGEYWAVSISGDCSIIKNRIKRKIAEKRISTKNVLRTGIKSIEKLDNVSHSIIEVDGDGLIMLDDFTVIKACG